jgi:toxin FitB
MFLIDTNVISELQKNERANPGVIEWFVQTPPSRQFFSVVTAIELERGVGLLERKDAIRGQHLRTWVDKILLEYAARLISVDTSIARLCGRLHVEKTRPYNDALIAATAMIGDKTVVTRNVQDFVTMGARVINPFR